MEILYIALLTLLASAAGTVTGFGTSTIMIPVLVMFLPPVEAIFLVAVIHWFGNVWKVLLFRRGIDLRLILLFGVTGFMASFLGALVSLGTEAAILLRLLGGFLVLYALFLLVKPRFAVPARDGVAVGGGVLSGFFAGMFGIGGAIRAMFLSAFDLPKAVYIATAGAIGLLVDSTRIAAYLAGGTELPERLLIGLLVFIPVSLLGAALARSIVDRVPQQRFRQIIAIFLLLAGAKLMVNP